MPMSQLLIDAEDGHKLAILAAKKNLLFSPKISSNENELLVSIFLKVSCCCRSNIILSKILSINNFRQQKYLD